MTTRTGRLKTMILGWKDVLLAWGRPAGSGRHHSASQAAGNEATSVVTVSSAPSR